MIYTMRNMLYLTFCFIATVIKLSRAGGLKAVSAENIALRQQLIFISKNRKRSPQLTLFAMQISNAFGVQVDKDVVRRVFLDCSGYEAYLCQ